MNFKKVSMQVKEVSRSEQTHNQPIRESTETLRLAKSIILHIPKNMERKGEHTTNKLHGRARKTS